LISGGSAAKQARGKMRPSDRIAAGIALFLGTLLIAAFVLFSWPVLDHKFHLVSERMRQVAVDYEFRLLGLFLLLFASFCGLLEAIWWIGRKLKVPYVILLLICLSLLAAAYLWLAHALRGTLRG